MGIAMMRSYGTVVKKYYEQRAPREQKLLLLCVFCCVALLVFYGLVQPLVFKYEDARAHYQNTQKQWAWIQANDASFQQLAKQGGDLNAAFKGSLLSLVNQTARKSNIVLKRFEPKGSDKLRVWLEQVNFDQLVIWLEIFHQKGLDIAQISLDRQDHELGQVSAQILLVRSRV